MYLDVYPRIISLCFLSRCDYHVPGTRAISIATEDCRWWLLHGRFELDSWAQSKFRFPNSELISEVLMGEFHNVHVDITPNDSSSAKEISPQQDLAWALLRSFKLIPRKMGFSDYWFKLGKQNVWL